MQIDKLMNAKPPTWHREALEQNIDYIFVFHDKAEGLIFQPRNLTKPFLIGGDHGGGYPMDAASAIREYENNFARRYQRRGAWFLKYMEMVRDGADFSLSDLERERPSLKIKRSGWP
ncbi:MAG: hypothetical protein R3200_14190 [Xanthomonadales bacterium]|nr:hypothetical protein [Xanthomonadales bacterium]